MIDDSKFIAVMSDLIDISKSAPAGQEILLECLEIASLLLEKNISYGNSALDPIRVFAADIDAGKQIDIKIDDKLSRIKRGNEFPGDDTILDLAGYLVLKLIHQKRVREIGDSNGQEEED